MSKERLMELQVAITEHDVLYEKNQPIISDTEYDALYREMLLLETEYPEMREGSPSQRIVTSLVKTLEKVSHTTPMLSLDKANTWEEVEAFLTKHQQTVLLQEKMDGLTVVLEYRDTHLVDAVSRGSGYVGERLIHTVRTIASVPKRIAYSGYLKVRVEVIIPYDAFNAANVDGKYASPRNLASGTVRQLDAAVAASRGLQAVAMEVVESDGPKTTDETQLAFLNKLGFMVVWHRVFTKHQFADLRAAIEEYETTKRAKLPYMIDGLVIKLDSLSARNNLGSTNKYPRWAIAYKFKSLDATTVLRAVVPQVGKTGQITPVAQFDMVDIDGVEVRRATLHNYRNIAEKDIRIGDTIMVARANDVIPQVVKAFHELRTVDTTPIAVPTACPNCGGEVAFVGEHLKCLSDACSTRKIGQLQHFVSRNAMNMDSLGGKTIELLYQEGLVQEYDDIFTLHEKRGQLLLLPKFGERKVEKILEAIEQAKSASFSQLLYALSIDLIGETASKQIAKEYGSFVALLKASETSSFEQELLALQDFGEKMAKSLVMYLQNEENRARIERVLAFGIKAVEERAAITESVLTGKVIVITGSFTVDRKELKKRAEAQGAKVTGSVSKKTDILFMGEEAEGTSKHQAAIANNVEIWGKEQVEAFL